ncbi:DUF982 domain-containing protein [Mesorhizobium sp. M0815]|uniref:DUF982 domain-containing protein n=1 Tax=Mesorhizobium sp. M0815 TaxID=2957005 RepID=UPI003337064B
MSSGTFSSHFRKACSAHRARDCPSCGCYRFSQRMARRSQRPIHEAALRACFDAYNGRKPASAARKSFFRFAKQVVILEDATSAMQLAACMSDSGKAQV